MFVINIVIACHAYGEVSALMAFSAVPIIQARFVESREANLERLGRSEVDCEPGRGSVDGAIVIRSITLELLDLVSAPETGDLVVARINRWRRADAA